MTARILIHTARLHRRWLLVSEASGMWLARLTTAAGVVEVSTESGTLFLVRDAIRNGPHRGLPEQFAPADPPYDHAIKRNGGAS